MAKFEDKRELYENLVNRCSRFDKKGKTTAYTSANGHMFSFLNKEGEIGFRFSKEVQEAYFEKYNTDYYMSHGAVMKGYILVTDNMLKDLDEMVQLLNESYDFVMSLDPK